jgi:outer membrane protein assembly factor BamB
MKRDDDEQDSTQRLSQAIIHRLGLTQQQELRAASLDELRARLNDPDAAVRAAALRVLASQGEETPLEWLLLALHDDDWFVRERAIRALGQHASTPLEPLLAALRDEDASVRAAALSVLSKRAGNVPLEHIADALLDSDQHVREMAAQALQQAREEMPETLWQAAAGNFQHQINALRMPTLAAPVPMEHHNGHTLQPLFPVSERDQQQKKDRLMTIKKQKKPGRFSALSQQLGTISAMLCVALLVGSMAIVFSSLRAHNQQSQGSAITGNSKNTPAPGVYVSSLQTDISNRLTRLNMQNGQVIWQKFDQQNYPSTIVDGVIYETYEDAASYNAYVLAMNASNGALLWKVNLGSETHTISIQVPHIPTQAPGTFALMRQSHSLVDLVQQGHSSTEVEDLGDPSSAVVVNGVVYLTRASGILYALRASDGSQLWTYNSHAQDFANGSDYSPPIPVVTGNVVYSTIYHKMFAVSATTGKQVWAVTLDQSQIFDLFNSPQIMNGVISISSDSVSQHIEGINYYHYLYAYSAANGSRIWRKLVETTTLPTTLMSTATNNIAYYTIGDTLYAVLASSGSALWSRNLGGEVDYMTPVIVGNALYISANGEQNGPNPTLFALDATNGDILWQRPIDVWTLAATNNTVYVGADHALLLALDATSGKMQWQRSFYVPVKNKIGESMAQVFEIIPVS